MHLQRLYLGLKHFGIFFNMACLLGHLIRCFKVWDITGSQLLKIFEMSHSVTLNLNAISLFVSPNRSFMRMANRWSSRVREPRTTSTLSLTVWRTQLKRALVRPVKNSTCAALHLREAKENCVLLTIAFNCSFLAFSLLMSTHRLSHSVWSWLYFCLRSSWTAFRTVASEKEIRQIEISPSYFHI